MDCIRSGSSLSVNEFITPDKSLRLQNVVEESTDVTRTMEMGKKKLPKIRKMYLAALTSLLMAVAMGLATGYSAPATYDMTTRVKSPVKPTKSEITWIGSTLAIGAMMGGIFAGPLADKLGRKDMLIFNVVPFAAGWLFICYAKDTLIIVIGRFFCGLACGVVSVTVPMYCVEISTAEVRGLLGSAFQGFLVIGNLISVIIGSYITWQYLALMGAASTAFGVICFITMPETPRWLLAKGNLNGAIEVMHSLQGGYVDAKEECNEIYKDLQNEKKGSLSWSEFKHPTICKPALISIALMFFQQFSGANAVFFYSSTIFKISKDFMDPKKATIVLGLAQVVATLLSNVTVDKLGRKLLLLLSGVFMAFSLLALGMHYYLSTSNDAFKIKYSWVPLASLILFVISFSIGYGPIPWLLAAEMVPVRGRSTVSGLATISNGLFAFIVTKTFSELEDVIQTYGTFWTYSILSIIGVIFVSFILPETKGKKLEEISKMFYTPKVQDRTVEIATVL